MRLNFLCLFTVFVVLQQSNGPCACVYTHYQTKLCRVFLNKNRKCGMFQLFKGTLSSQNHKILLTLFPCQMPQNIQLNWIKGFYRAKQKPQLGNKVQDCNDRRGLQFIKFDLVMGDQEIKVAIHVEFCLF